MRRGMQKGLRYLTFAALTCLSATAHAQQAADAVAPEAGSEISAFWPNASKDVMAAPRTKAAGQPVIEHEWTHAASNTLTAAAGAKLLHIGVSAGYAIAHAQAVLGLGNQ